METQTGTARRIGLATLAFARKQTLEFLDDITRANAAHQPFAGANHAAWIAGHIAWEDDSILTDLKPRPSAFAANDTKLFGTGSSALADVSAYPTLDELREKLNALRAELVTWFSNLSDEQLLAPLPKEHAGYAMNFAGLMSTLAWHEGLHAGQLTVVRKSLGMKPKVM